MPGATRVNALVLQRRVKVPEPALVAAAAKPIGCPNANWTATIRPGPQTLLSFSYTLTFVGFTSAYITISQP